MSEEASEYDQRVAAKMREIAERGLFPGESEWAIRAMAEEALLLEEDDRLIP